MSKRNANMGSIRQRADGRWEGRYTDPTGRQRSVYGQTQREAAAALKAKQREVDTGTWIEPHRMTLREWVDTWLNDYADNTPKTRAYYRQLCTLYALPTLGDCKLTSLNAIHVRRMLRQLQDRQEKDALSPTTIAQALAVLRICLNAAVSARLILSNPANDVPMPRKNKTVMHIIDKPLFPAFLEAARRTHYPEALILLLQTGLRTAELRGLTWNDVDEERSVIHVRNQLDTSKAGAPALRPPKDNSARDIVVGPEVLATLKAQRRRLAEYRLKAGAAWNDTPFAAALVVRTINGNPMDAQVIYQAARRVGDAIGLPGLHPHDLRHSYAVAALRSGADVKTVQHNLGHSSARMTLDTYAAYTTDAAQAAAAKMSAYWTEAIN